MKITVINGTEKHGVTYKLKEIFLDELRDRAEITDWKSNGWIDDKRPWKNSKSL